MFYWAKSSRVVLRAGFGASLPGEPAEGYAASSMPSINSSQNSTAPETSAGLVHP